MVIFLGFRGSNLTFLPFEILLMKAASEEVMFEVVERI